MPSAATGLLSWLYIMRRVTIGGERGATRAFKQAVIKATKESN
jgi:hypothetical protein